MNFKSTSPDFGNFDNAKLEMLHGYIEDIKSEIEAKLTHIENTLEKLKEFTNSLKEADI